jgi:hypothetical protein
MVQASSITMNKNIKNQDKLAYEHHTSMCFPIKWDTGVQYRISGNGRNWRSVVVGGEDEGIGGEGVGVASVEEMVCSLRRKYNVVEVNMNETNRNHNLDLLVMMLSLLLLIILACCNEHNNNNSFPNSPFSNRP